jgi:hypothetical protein
MDTYSTLINHSRLTMSRILITLLTKIENENFNEK